MLFYSAAISMTLFLNPSLEAIHVQEPEEIPGLPLPDPETEQEPDPSEKPETDEPQSLEEALEILQELMDEVRDGFRKVDSQLSSAREKADAVTDDDKEVRDDLAKAVEEADQLLLSLEELLESIPEQDSQSQSSSNSQSQSSMDREQERKRDQERNPKDDSESENQSKQQYTDVPPPDGLRQILLFDPRMGAWGALPPRLQATMENATAEDLPLRYRRWLDEYHRRSIE